MPVSTKSPESSKLPPILEIHVQPCRRRRLFLPADSSSGEEAPDIFDARLIEIQMSILRRYKHILPNGNGERGRWRSECGVLLVSLAMSKTVVGSRPCLLSNFVRTRISSSKVVHLRLVHRCCFIAMLDRQICLGSGADLFLSRPRRPPRLALTCVECTTRPKAIKIFLLGRRSRDKCSLCINRD